jgi:hypothetical protein
MGSPRLCDLDPAAFAVRVRSLHESDDPFLDCPETKPYYAGNEISGVSYNQGNHRETASAHLRPGAIDFAFAANRHVLFLNRGELRRGRRLHQKRGTTRFAITRSIARTRLFQEPCPAYGAQSLS